MSNKSALAQVPDSSTLEKTEESIRLRAYAFYMERGCLDGHDVEDWLLAEAEVLGKKQPVESTRARAAVRGAA